MTEIQKAGDVLAKWRSKSDPAPWVVDDDEESKDIWSADDINITASSVHENNVALIVGTAGNPDLLDVNRDVLTYGLLHIDLRDAGEPYFPVVIDIAQRLAVAILAADEQMSA